MAGERPSYDELAEFVACADHDAGCVGGTPRYRCKCGLRDLRQRLGVTPEPEWPADDQPLPPCPSCDGTGTTVVMDPGPRGPYRHPVTIACPDCTPRRSET